MTYFVHEKVPCEQNYNFSVIIRKTYQMNIQFQWNVQPIFVGKVFILVHNNVMMPCYLNASMKVNKDWKVEQWTYRVIYLAIWVGLGQLYIVFCQILTFCKTSLPKEKYHCTLPRVLVVKPNINPHPLSLTVDAITLMKYCSLKNNHSDNKYR